eukprot:Awhi_evm1s1302
MEASGFKETDVGNSKWVEIEKARSNPTSPITAHKKNRHSHKLLHSQSQTPELTSNTMSSTLGNKIFEHGLDNTNDPDNNKNIILPYFSSVKNTKKIKKDRHSKSNSLNGTKIDQQGSSGIVDCISVNQSSIDGKTSLYSTGSDKSNNIDDKKSCNNKNVKTKNNEETDSDSVASYEESECKFEFNDSFSILRNRLDEDEDDENNNDNNNDEGGNDADVSDDEYDTFVNQNINKNMPMTSKDLGHLINKNVNHHHAIDGTVAKSSSANKKKDDGAEDRHRCSDSDDNVLVAHDIENDPREEEQMHRLIRQHMEAAGFAEECNDFGNKKWKSNSSLSRSQNSLYTGSNYNLSYYRNGSTNSLNTPSAEHTIKTTLTNGTLPTLKRKKSKTLRQNTTPLTNTRALHHDTMGSSDSLDLRELTRAPSFFLNSDERASLSYPSSFVEEKKAETNSAQLHSILSSGSNSGLDCSIEQCRPLNAKENEMMILGDKSDNDIMMCEPITENNYVNSSGKKNQRLQRSSSFTKKTVNNKGEKIAINNGFHGNRRTQNIFSNCDVKGTTTITSSPTSEAATPKAATPALNVIENSPISLGRSQATNTGVASNNKTIRRSSDPKTKKSKTMLKLLDMPPHSSDNTNRRLSNSNSDSSLVQKPMLSFSLDLDQGLHSCNFDLTYNISQGDKRSLQGK